MQVKKQQSEPDKEQQTGSKLGKKYFKAVYCHPAYLTYMQSTSCEIIMYYYLITINTHYYFTGWMKHKMESRLPGEMLIT